MVRRTFAWVNDALAQNFAKDGQIDHLRSVRCAHDSLAQMA
jgi:hypothetical protein